VPPKYGSVCFLPESRFFANGDGFTAREWPTPCFKAKEIWERGKSKTDIDFLVDFLVVYGKVTYKDTLTGGKENEILHETRWCCLYRSPQIDFVPCGPAEYNEYSDYQTAIQDNAKRSPISRSRALLRFTRL